MDNKDVRFPDLTFCIMTYDDSITIGACLKRLLHQDIIPNILICDAGSYDGTPEMLQKQIDNKWWNKGNGGKVATVKLIHHGGRGKVERKAYAYNKMVAMVETKYIFFINSTLLLPPFCVLPLLEVIESRPELGLLGIRGPVFMDDNHICIDPSIIRTEHAKGISFEGRLDRCVCRNVHPYFHEKGMKMEYDTRFMASHLRTLYGWG
jgi:hypothetical protein